MASAVCSPVDKGLWMARADSGRQTTPPTAGWPHADTGSPQLFANVHLPFCGVYGASMPLATAHG